MTTASLQGLDTILVIFLDFERPSRSFVEDYATNVQSGLSLSVQGISVQMAQDTLWWLRSRPHILLPQEITLDAVVA